MSKSNPINWDENHYIVPGAEVERIADEYWEYCKNWSYRFNYKPDKGKEKMMHVFQIIVVDKMANIVMQEQTVIAKDRESAILSLRLAHDEKIDKKVLGRIQDDEIELIVNELGSYAPVKRNRRRED